MSTEDEINKAESEVKAAHSALEDARKRLHALYVRRSTELFGIEPGMRVRVRDSEFIIDEIRPESWVGSKPWLYGRKIKKDGTPGEQSRTIYGDWQITLTGAQ